MPDHEARPSPASTPGHRTSLASGRSPALRNTGRPEKKPMRLTPPSYPGRPEVRNTLRTESLRCELRNTGTPAGGRVGAGPSSPEHRRTRRGGGGLLPRTRPERSGRSDSIVEFGAGRPQAGRFGGGLGSDGGPPAATLPAPILACPKSRYPDASNGTDYRSSGVPGQPRRATVGPSRRSGVPGYRTVRPGGGGPDLRATRPPRRRRKGDRVPRDSGGPRLRGGRAIFRLARHTGPPEYSPDTAGFS